jgi:carbon monoxide dehydrogenase subunit G
MKMTGEQKLAASRQRVWEALNDPNVLKQCIPGCQSLEKESDERLKAIVAIKIGPIGARFTGAVTLSELDPPNGYLISGEGQGGAAGFAKGAARVRLTDDGPGALLTYEVDAEVGGRLAQVGGAIIDATAKQLAGAFFKKFGEVVAGPKAEPQAAKTPAPAPLAAPSGAESQPAPLAGPAQAPAVPSAPDRAPLQWFLSVFLAALAGYLAAGGSAAWIGLVVGAVVAGLALVGFEFGRRSGQAAKP